MASPGSSPNLDLPASGRTVEVSIIDTGNINGLPLSLFMGPDIPGFDTIQAVIFTFLVEHIDDAGMVSKVLFDLGMPKDVQNDLAPSQWDLVTTFNCTYDIPKYVSEILSDGGMDLNTINAMVWSHPHLDHVGRPSLFPSTTDLIVGPGLLASEKGGYPGNPQSPILEREFLGRKITELDFSASPLKIGGMEALDYFGDGSFYFLSAPGHAPGHINALARTTNQPDTFIYLGADSFHHASELRPHKYHPLPNKVRLSAFSPFPCLGELFHKIHPSSRPDPGYAKAHDDPNTTPFYSISEKEDGSSLAVDKHAARDTISKIQLFDADENIFVIGAHDTTLIDYVDVFPKKANGWKAKGWKEHSRWQFLRDFEKPLSLLQS